MKTTRKITILTSLVLAVCVTVVYAATLNIRRMINANAPPTPTDFQALMNSDNVTNVFFTWVNASTDYSNVVIEISTVPPAWTVVTNLVGTNVAFTYVYTWTNLPPYFRIKSTYTNGLESAYNNAY